MKIKHVITEDDTKPSGLLKKCSELRKLLAENPDLPVLFSTDCYSVDNRYETSFCFFANVEKTKFLDCTNPIDDERSYLWDDNFEQDVRDMLDNLPEYEGLTDEELDKEADEIVAMYEPYWRDCIHVHITN